MYEFRELLLRFDGENRRKRQRCDHRSLFPSPSRITSRLLRRLECVARRIVASHCALMVVIICGKCGNNRSRTENITEWTRFSKSRSNDFEDIGHCQGSLYATHPLILMIICAKYYKNPSRTVDFFSRSRTKNVKNSAKIQISRFWKKHNTLTIVIICAKYKKNPSRTVDATERTRFSKSRPNDLEDIGHGQGSSHARHTLSCYWLFVPNMERIHPEL